MAVTQRDWSLHRKGPADAARHAEKLKEAIKNNLPEIVSDEAIITSDGKKTVKIPIRGLELPQYRYGSPGKIGGQGKGSTGKGAIVASDPSAGDGTGKDKGAGSQPGQDYYEAEISIDELAELIFADLRLPKLKHKRTQDIESDAVAFHDVRKKGLLSNLDKRRTLLANAKRRAMAGKHGVGEFTDDDLRFKTWVPVTKQDNSAVVIAMRDASGSMGDFEKYMTRSFYFWVVRFLRTKYQRVQIVFITHHTEAQEVDEQAFFHLGESGGTLVSSAYTLAKQIIEERYNPAHWNIYALHFTDGDNWGEDDNERCAGIVKELLGICNVFGYAEVRHYSTAMSTLWGVLKAIGDDRLLMARIGDKADLWPALLHFFSDEL